MIVQPHVQTEVAVGRQGVLRRRDFLRFVAAAGAAGSLSFADVMSLHASELRSRGMACILLWMQGGPSQFETFSPKPDHDNGGPTKSLATNVPGVHISENLPETARVMERVCLIRSMTSREGSHPRATFLLHTGYLPTASVKYPTLGSIVAHQVGDPESELPSFVRVGGRGFVTGGGGGLLGVQYDPFDLPVAGRLPDNVALSTTTARYNRRLGLLDRLEADFARNGARQEVEDHRRLYEKAARMVLSPRMQAFDLAQEPRAVREAYGSSDFAAGCLLARRLVETGVTFVEVGMGNWDTHNDNFTRSAQLCQSIDRPYAQLLRDLAERGLLDQTLVIWMGEFGRTPRINPRTGRDHYPRAFDVALAGGGIQGGQVIGETSKGGEDVTKRPVTVPDLFRTFCRSLKINADHENNSPIGRPIRIVEGGKAVEEAFG
jgi:uncharacterized protein (DUF1501 family)